MKKKDTDWADIGKVNIGTKPVRPQSIISCTSSHRRGPPNPLIVGIVLPLAQMTADEPEEEEFELGDEGRFQKSHLRLHWRLW